MSSYRNKLRNLIGDPANGLLFDARDQRDPYGVVRRTENSAFYFPPREGRPASIRQAYVSLWGLFRNPQILEEALGHFTEVVASLLDSHGPVDALATCTATGRYLMEYLQPRLRERGIDIPTAYLGIYPLTKKFNDEEVHDKRFLMITDVVATGTVVNQVSELLATCSARLAAVATVVVTKNQDNEAPRQVVTRPGLEPVPLGYLLDYCLPDLAPEATEGWDLIKITPGEILSRLIADQKNGMLLGPVVSGEPGDLRYEGDTRLYRAPSGGVQRHFITLWPLFDKLLYFEDCMDHLASLAREIREKQFYSTIVTCTATGQHLLEHLQPRIETADSPVESAYLGPYPYHLLAKLSPTEFKNQKVLILTDVLASMTLVRNIASVVQRLGGTVAAVLGVVRLRTAEEPGDREIEYAPKATARVEALCDFHIEKVDPCPPDAEVREIDAETILPKDPNEGGDANARNVEPAYFRPFSEAETIRHLDESKALRMGFFEVSGRLFTAGVRLPKLFAEFGPAIWEKMRPALAGGGLLVTTTDREDLRLLDFVQKWSSSRPIGALLVPRYDSLGFDFPYFLPEESRARLKGQRVILLLHSVQTSEKLRRLISLLAQEQLAAVEVICLFNRMGDHAADFIARIKQMTSGIGSDRKEGAFNFHWLYALPDLQGTELVSTLDSIRRLYTLYCERSPSPAFKSLFDEELRYFRVRSFLRRQVEDDSPRPLAEPVNAALRGGEEIRVTTWDALVYLTFSRDRRTARAHETLTELLATAADRNHMYLVLILLLVDVSFYRSNKDVAKIKRRIYRAVKACRVKRLRAERRGAPTQADLFEQCQEIARKETYLLFSLAVICYLDNGPDGYPWVLATMRGGLVRDSWRNYPVNFQAYYWTSRTLWCVSLLMRFAELEKSVTAEQYETWREELSKWCHQNQGAITRGEVEIAAVNGETFDTSRRRMSYAFDALLMDLGVHQLDRRDRVLMFLNNRVGFGRTHHNSLNKDVKEAITSLTRHVKAGRSTILPAEGEASRGWKSQVDKAIQAVALLKLVGDAAAELYQWYRLAASDEAKRFLEKAEGNGFRGDIETIRTSLSRIRKEEALLDSDVRVLEKAYEHVAKEMDTKGDSSSLRSAIDYYLPELSEWVATEMRSADEFLAREYGVVWGESAAEFEPEGCRSEMCRVVCDPLLLKEVLWNIFTNVRHGLVKGASDNAERVGLAISYAPPEQSRVTIEVRSPLVAGANSPESGHTWHRHAGEIELYGGSLKFLTEGSISVKVEFNLIRLGSQGARGTP